ncbi:MAG TPA: bifunctional ADP-heptose synthase [Bacteroidales bacterium]|nr:bifunctional ADP-heptose synthase [Bacteroidales bacterium]
MLTLDKSAIEKIFRDFCGLKVLVIGDVMLDSYIWGKVDRISPEAPVPVVSVTRRENRLGGAANVALNIRSLGATPLLCSINGRDQKGDDFNQLLQKNDISFSGILRSEKRITTTKFRIIGNNFQMLRVDEEMVYPLDQEETRDFYLHIERIIQAEKPGVILFEDYDKGVINQVLITWIVELAEKLKIPVVADPKKKNFQYYKNIELFKPNYKELCDGLKIDNIHRQPEDLLKICSGFQHHQNIQKMMLTLSELGIFISSHTKTGAAEGVLIPSRVRNVSDVSGAGDTVISVAALCTALNLPFYDTAYIANTAGGMVCEEPGVVPVNKENLLKELLSLI